MLHRGVYLLCLCIVAMQLLQDTVGLAVRPEVRAHLEAKVMKSMSLKDIEAMVEQDERVMNAPKSKIIIIPKKRSDVSGEDDREAIIIHRKPKKSYKDEGTPEYRFVDLDMEKNLRRTSFEPDFEFDRGFRPGHDDFPFFQIADFESARSAPVKSFYESIVSRIMDKQNFGLSKDPFEILDIAASEDVPAYKPRFDYNAYSKDSTETKLQGKPYWRDAPERREETVDENGCRTVVKKIVDPEDEKKSSGANAKSVVITKECEYPTLNGPDAKIIEGRPLRQENARYDAETPSRYANYEEEPASYEKVRPEELNFQKPESRDPLAPDYIDSMLEKHFKSFPGFSNPLTSFRGYQERFQLRAPEAIKNVKPTVGVETYEYTHPKSGFEDGQGGPAPQGSTYVDAPRTFDLQHPDDYLEEIPRDLQNKEYPDEDKISEKSSDDSKEPKMLKKSFAYYRKDNPKTDPDDHQYAEEYAQGNYRSFSSSYDSEKDGPKKKQQ